MPLLRGTNIQDPSFISWYSLIHNRIDENRSSKDETVFSRFRSLYRQNKERLKTGRNPRCWRHPQSGRRGEFSSRGIPVLLRLKCSPTRGCSRRNSCKGRRGKSGVPRRGPSRRGGKSTRRAAGNLGRWKRRFQIASTLFVCCSYSRARLL